ncbi:MAG: DUF3842 family protein [Ruminococcaceae bacterium]|nr:DUF3842 family protein [Oscillospiraceae bacterium]
MKILVIDGQGGRIGRLLVEGIKKTCPDADIIAVGTNSIATSAMMKGGADQAATGENSVIVCTRDADVIVGPVGIAIADSLLGEITPAMALAVGQSSAVKLLIPVSKCNNRIVGADEMTLSSLIDKTVKTISDIKQRN